MKNFKLSVLASALFFTAFSNAAEQPQAQDLVGKFYGGAHYSLIKPDEDRLKGINDDFELGDGLGIEFGYRYSESTEFRLAFTDLDIKFEKAADKTGDTLSFDVLYFPTQQNAYVLGGVNNLDIGNSEVTANLGLGYRHYFSERLAAYAEAKAHFHFGDSWIDQSAQFGLIYFFGDSAKPAKKAALVAPKKAAPVAPAKVAPVAAAPKDSDKDGVIDAKDKCASTPMNDKVDASGCTIFTEETLSQRLLINFDNNQAVVKKEYYDEITKIANFLKKYPHTSMTIAGHSSSQGSAAYNLTLSQKRADAVVAVLVNDFGIKQSRLTAKGYGETLLINPENTAAAHKENRRIEANVSVTQKIKVTR